MTKDEEIAALRRVISSVMTPEKAKALTGKRTLKRLNAAVEKPDWAKTKKTCPHCGHEKKVLPDFGIRNVRGVERPQPWCRDCRNGTNYHNQPRKNRTKNWPGP